MRHLQSLYFRAIALMLSAFLVITGTLLVLGAVETGEYGNIFRYNGVMFGDFYAHRADVEGALAVAGNGQFSDTGQNFDLVAMAWPGDNSTVVMGEEYQESDIYPSLLLGGTAAIGGTCNVYGGNVVMTQSQQAAYEAQERQLSVYSSYGVEYHAEGAVQGYFAAARQKIDDIVKSLTQADGGTMTESQLKDFRSADLSGFENADILGGTRVLIIHVDGGDSLNVGDIYVPDLSAYDLVIINIYASSVSFSGGSLLVGTTQIDTGQPVSSSGNALVKEYANRLIWSLPNATTVDITAYGVVGSVFAPAATVNANGGSINGRLLCTNLYQHGGFELHNFSINHSSKLLDLEPDESSSEPEESSGEPDESSSEPDESSSEPDESSSEPDESSSEPDESSSEPDESSGEPNESSSEPDESSSEPDESSGEPDESSGEPDESSSEPDDSSSKPDESSGTSSSSRSSNSRSRDRSTSERPSSSSSAQEVSSPAEPSSDIAYDVQQSTMVAGDSASLNNPGTGRTTAAYAMIVAGLLCATSVLLIRRPED